MALQSTSQKAQSPPPSQLRHRPLARAATSADMSNGPTLRHRRSSLFSDNVSEARRSFRSSVTDDLYPRANGSADFEGHHDTSHWNSVPLVLALLPAVGGLLFNNGSAVVTDITLLALAAIFLNWSLRLPWEWYASSQAVQQNSGLENSSIDAIAEESDREEESDAPRQSSKDSSQEKRQPRSQKPDRTATTRKITAERELRAHELVALATCFLGPVCGAWLLHAIRSQLSRPSEGLVSNYNLTVFLLGAEIRPMSHLIKLIQERTLHLQRVVMTESLDADAKDQGSSVRDIVKRLGDVEYHLADLLESENRKPTQEAMAAKTASQVTSDVRKGMQPELDALNRAMRRYEKRTTITTIQTEARLQDLESRLKDALVLAAAAQRDVDRRRSSFLSVLYSNISAILSIPKRLFWTVVKVPMDATSWATRSGGAMLKGKPAQQRPPKRNGDLRPRDRERKSKPNL